MIQELVLDAKVRMGELTMAIPKAGGGDRRSTDFKSITGDTFEKPKRQVIEELGFSKGQVSRMERLARNREEEVSTEVSTGTLEVST